MIVGVPPPSSAPSGSYQLTRKRNPGIRVVSSSKNMWSTTMARNFPSPMMCNSGGGMCGGAVPPSPRRRHPILSTTRGLFVPPLSPLNRCIPRKQHIVTEERDSTPTRKAPTSISCPPDMILNQNNDNSNLIQPPASLEIDTRCVSVVSSSDNENEPRSCVHRTKRAFTPRSSFRRTQRDIPSPAPTLDTVSCGSSCESSLTSKTSTVPTGRKRVTFGNVEIREHPRILGDNPSVKRGPALSIGWYDNGRQHSYDVDTFEAIRANQRRSNITLSSTARKKLLLRHCNVTLQDIRMAKMEIAKIKRSRRHHNSTCVEFDNTVDVMEQCVQTVQGIFTGRLADWELAKLMEQAALAEQAASVESR